MWVQRSANISALPLRLPWALRVAAHSVISAALRRYKRAYRKLRPLDDQAVIYYEVFRAVTQLVSVGQARAAGRVGGCAFHSAAGVGNLIALIRKLSSVSLRLEKRAWRSGVLSVPLRMRLRLSRASRPMTVGLARMRHSDRL